MTDPLVANRSTTGGTTALGIICIILGLIAMCSPVFTGISIAMILGGIVLVGGIVRLVWAFKAPSLGKGLLVFIIGGLTVICGIVLLANPLLAISVLTILLAMYLFLDGIAEIAAGVQAQAQSGSGWLIFGGIVSILLGAMIWAQYPLSGAWAMGILLGIKLLFVGMIMVTGSSAARKLAQAVEPGV